VPQNKFYYYGVLTSRPFKKGEVVSCENSIFSDVVKNKGKFCYVDGKNMASEKQTFTMPADGIALYGVANFNSLGPRVEVSCSNGTFGDPLASIAKNCYNNIGNTLAAEGAKFTTAPDSSCGN
jgi:hypothetical protein